MIGHILHTLNFTEGELLANYLFYLIDVHVQHQVDREGLLEACICLVIKLVCHLNIFERQLLGERSMRSQVKGAFSLRVLNQAG